MYLSVMPHVRQHTMALQNNIVFLKATSFLKDPIIHVRLFIIPLIELLVDST